MFCDTILLLHASQHPFVEFVFVRLHYPGHPRKGVFLVPWVLLVDNNQISSQNVLARGQEAQVVGQVDPGSAATEV